MGQYVNLLMTSWDSIFATSENVKEVQYQTGDRVGKSIIQFIQLQFGIVHYSVAESGIVHYSVTEFGIAHYSVTDFGIVYYSWQSLA